MENDLFKKKMDIAKRAGELNAEINRLTKIIVPLISHKDNQYAISIKLNCGSSDIPDLNSGVLEGQGTDMHKSLIFYLESQIDKRKAELDELIKVLQ